jgi:hypothetical protein
MGMVAGYLAAVSLYVLLERNCEATRQTAVARVGLRKYWREKRGNSPFMYEYSVLLFNTWVLYNFKRYNPTLVSNTNTAT